MIRADYTDRDLVVNILTRAFNENLSVNYMVRQDGKRAHRIRYFMEYSFDVCDDSGEVFLSEDKTGCALVLFPDQRSTTLKTALLDIKLVAFCLGLSNIKKTLAREAKIKNLHPEHIYHIWFLGVEPNEQNKGTGSRLLSELIQDGRSRQRSICLETSTLKNIPWYEKFGFHIYHELDLGYRLFMMRHE